LGFRGSQPMSTNTAAADTKLSAKATRLAQYLRNEVSDSNGEIYVKGKFISDDVGLSSKEIGALMLQLQDAVSGLSIEKWSYSSATTWRVANET